MMRFKQNKVALMMGVQLGLLSLVGCSTSKPSDKISSDTSVPKVVASQTELSKNTLNKRMYKETVVTQALSVAPMLMMGEPSLRPNTEKYQHTTPNAVNRVVTTPISTFSIDVDTGSYANVRRFLNEGRLPPVDSVRIEEFVNYFDYQYPKPADEPFLVSSRVIESPWQPHAKIIRIGIKAKEMSKQERPPANLVFLIDVSGSMSEPNKLGLAKKTLRLLTQQLTEQDSITLISYASGETMVLQPTTGTPQNKEKILAAINGLKAGGATAGEQALQLAYQSAQKSYLEQGINRILLMTDGDFNVGVTDFETLKGTVSQKKKSGISLSTFGFGTDNYNEYLMEQLADAGDGNYSYIDNESEAKKVLQRQLTSTLATVAQDVKVQVEFNPATVKEYRLIGYENRVLKEEDFNNDNVDAGDIGAGHTVTALYEVIPVGQKGWLNDSRYQSSPSNNNGDNNGDAQEYAHIAIRYKLPNDNRSQLIEAPIQVMPVAQMANEDDQWALAVVSFAQALKGGQYNGQVDYEDIIRWANTAKTSDDYGLKEEFIELVKIAKSLSLAPSGE